MSGTFCMLAWKHLQINPEGTAKICCRAQGSITDNNGHPYSLYQHSVKNIWNSEYMQNVRRLMVLGEKVPACQSCYDDESRVGGSYRTASNHKWLNTFSTTIEGEKERAIANSFVEEDNPVYVQFNMGNLCNLKCRMCNSTYSSRIEDDPVHTKWSPHLEFQQAGLLSWSDDNTVVIAPHPLKEVEYQGFRDFFMFEGRPLRWTEGDGCIELKLPADTKLHSMILTLWHFSGPDGLLKVMVNNETVFDGVPPRGRWIQEFELTSIAVDEKLQIRIVSPTFSTNQDGNLGVAVEEIKLCRESEERKKSPNIVFSRFDNDVFWFEDDGLIFEEFLGNFETLQEIYFTGGEPLIHSRVEAVIDFLIEKKVAKNITLQFNSNCTNVKDDFLMKLSQFRQVDFALSVDGMGADYEYIRYPSRWSNVSKNILKLKNLPNANLTAVPMVQIYNLLNIVNFCRFCDDVGIIFALMVLFGPQQLSVLVMPSQARQLAVSRLREYANNDCFEHNKSTVLALVQYLESGPDWCNTEMFKHFMLFTNDLDASRGQSFLDTYPRLVSLFEKAGFAWSLETLYSEQHPQRIHS